MSRLPGKIRKTFSDYQCSKGGRSLINADDTQAVIDLWKEFKAMSEQVYVNLGHSGGPFFVHVKDGKIIRVRPMTFRDDEEVPTDLGNLLCV